jgi:hypothetical protein
MRDGVETSTSRTRPRSSGTPSGRKKEKSDQVEDVLVARAMIQIQQAFRAGATG